MCTDGIQILTLIAYFLRDLVIFGVYEYESFCNYQFIMMYLMQEMFRFIFQMVGWSFSSNLHQAFCNTADTRKRKYSHGVDRIVAKRRNKRRQQHAWMTLEMQFISACCCSCSISIILFFIWPGRLSPHMVKLST